MAAILKMARKTIFVHVRIFFIDIWLILSNWKYVFYSIGRENKTSQNFFMLGWSIGELSENLINNILGLN